MSLKTLVRQTIEAGNQVSATVEEYAAGKATVRLSSNGARYFNLPTYGYTLNPGDEVYIELFGGKPIVKRKYISFEDEETMALEGESFVEESKDIGFDVAGYFYFDPEITTVVATTNESITIRFNGSITDTDDHQEGDAIIIRKSGKYLLSMQSAVNIGKIYEIVTTEPLPVSPFEGYYFGAPQYHTLDTLELGLAYNTSYEYLLDTFATNNIYAIFSGYIDGDWDPVAAWTRTIYRWTSLTAVMNYSFTPPHPLQFGFTVARSVVGFGETSKAEQLRDAIWDFWPQLRNQRWWWDNNAYGTYVRTKGSTFTNRFGIRRYNTQGWIKYFTIPLFGGDVPEEEGEEITRFIIDGYLQSSIYLNDTIIIMSKKYEYGQNAHSNAIIDLNEGDSLTMKLLSTVGAKSSFTLSRNDDQKYNYCTLSLQYIPNTEE